MLNPAAKLSAITLPILTLLLNFDNLSHIFFHNQGNVRKILGLQPYAGNQEFDYIVVGSGSAGAVLANRLSEDPRTKVLLLEAGGNENFLTDVPIAASLLQKTELDWNYETVEQESACFGFKKRNSFWPRGKVFGGTSVLNVMLYVRGNPNDYNTWPNEWHWPEVFPYFLKSENNKNFDIQTNGFHSNKRGFLDVSSPPYTSPLARAFVDSATELGYPKLTDINGPSQSGFSLPQSTTRRGARCSTAKAFLYPISKRPNLTILASAMVTRVSFHHQFIDFF